MAPWCAGARTLSGGRGTPACSTSSQRVKCTRLIHLNLNCIFVFFTRETRGRSELLRRERVYRVLPGPLLPRVQRGAAAAVQVSRNSKTYIMVSKFSYLKKANVINQKMQWFFLQKWLANHWMEFINEEHTWDASRSKSGIRDQFVTILHSWIGTNLIELNILLSFIQTVGVQGWAGRPPRPLRQPEQPGPTLLLGLGPGPGLALPGGGGRIQRQGGRGPHHDKVNDFRQIRDMSVRMLCQNSARICHFQYALSVCTIMHALEFKGCKEQEEEGPVTNCNCIYPV